MKTFRYISVSAFAALFLLSACTTMEDIYPETGTLLTTQVNETTEIAPERGDAIYSGMYTALGQPITNSSRPDDFGFVMMAFSNDVEGPDVWIPDSGYNWFSVCGEYTSRNADYANPYIRYKECYDEIARAHDVMNTYGEITEDMEDDVRYKVAQAYAIRAFSYWNLAPYFQFNYQLDPSAPSVPLLTLETEDVTNNPRASLEDLYALMLSDLEFAIENLEGYVRPDKGKIDAQTAHALRSRLYLEMGEWQKAYDDAVAAAEGYTPASVAEVSTPTFMSVDEHNWIWGYAMTADVALPYRYATSSSWLRSFSGWSYSAGTQCYACINNMLYDMIPDTDVRKGWWVDEDLYSPLLEGLKWGSLSGWEVATGTITDEKEPFIQYTNVKFGCDPVGTTSNDEDWPFVRVEEMIITQAECQARLGNTGTAQTILEDFVKTYRDPSYSVNGRGLALLDEIWFQKRVELWGEGFSNADMRRLNKPLVRFHDLTTTSFPTAHAFNMAADDGWLLMRFCTDETNTNYGIVDNTGGSLPVSGQNADLMDGVTDNYK